MVITNYQFQITKMSKLRDYRQGDEAHVFRLMEEVLAIYGLKTNPVPKVS